LSSASTSVLFCAVEEAEAEAGATWEQEKKMMRERGKKAWGSMVMVYYKMGLMN